MNKLILTHVVRKEHTEKVLNGEYFMYERTHSFKPRGVWLSVNNGWEEWCRGNQPDWIEGRDILKVTLSKDIKLFAPKTIEEFKSKYKELTGHEYEQFNIRTYDFNLKFHQELEKLYDGFYLSGSVLYPNRMKMIYFYPWDAPSIVIWKNTDKMKMEMIKNG
jgi:hypothetical protein